MSASWGGFSRRGLLHAVIPTSGNRTACGKRVEQAFGFPAEIVAECLTCKTCARFVEEGR